MIPFLSVITTEAGLCRFENGRCTMTLTEEDGLAETVDLDDEGRHAALGRLPSQGGGQHRGQGGLVGAVQGGIGDDQRLVAALVAGDPLDHPKKAAPKQMPGGKTPVLAAPETGAEALIRSSMAARKKVVIPPPEMPVAPIRSGSISFREVR